MVDYYALQAVFAGIDKADREFDRDPAVGRRRRELERARRELPMLVERIDPSLLDPGSQQEVAEWEARLGASSDLWEALRTVSLDSENGAKLEARPDGSIVSGGERPERDTYTVVAETALERVTGFRLDATGAASRNSSSTSRRSGRYARSGTGGVSVTRLFTSSLEDC